MLGVWLTQSPGGAPMATAVSPAVAFNTRPAVETGARSRANSIPWFAWCLAAAVTFDAFGGYWDISWHISIGRDTFWTPAHMMVYLAGVLAGIASGYTILTTTFGSSSRERDAAVSIWGFRGPL